MEIILIYFNYNIILNLNVQINIDSGEILYLNTIICINIISIVCVYCIYILINVTIIQKTKN